MINRKLHVLTQLKSLPASYGLSISGKQAKIRCPSHSGGRERTPSLYIGLDHGKYKEGSWHCFGCEVEKTMDGGGTWNNLAELLGLEKIGGGPGGEKTFYANPLHVHEKDEEEDETEDEGKIRPANGEKTLLDRLIDTGDDEDEIDYSPMQYWPLWQEHRTWRGISGKTLRAVGARCGINSRNQDRLWLPVMVDGVIYSSIYCVYKKIEGQPSYIYDGSSAINEAVFPYDYVASMKKDYVVIVEGSRDALHLIDHGIPAVAVLGGVTSWNNFKRDLILELNPSLIILAPDPDDVGDALAEKMLDAYDREFRAVKWFKMRGEIKQVKDPRTGKVKDVKKKLEDPGELPVDRINALRSRAESYLQGLHSTAA